MDWWMMEGFVGVGKKITLNFLNYLKSLQNRLKFEAA
jgi:hypothetical protein